MARHGPGGRVARHQVPQARMGRLSAVRGAGGAGLHPALSGAAVARLGHWAQRAADPARHPVDRRHRGGAGDSHRPQLPGRAAEQALGSDRQPGVQPVGADPEGAARARRAGQDHRVRSGRRASTASATGSRNTPTRPSSSRSSTSTSTASRPARARPTSPPWARWCSTTRAASSASPRPRNRTSPTRSSRPRPARSARSTSRRVTARRTRPARERAGYSAVVEALKADNYGFEKLVLAQTLGRARGRRRGDRGGAAHRLLPRRNRRHQAVPGQGRQAARDARPRHQEGRGTAAERRCARGRLGHPGRRRRGRRRLGRGPDVRRRRLGAGGGQLPRASHHRALQPDDGLSAGAIDFDRDTRTAARRSRSSRRARRAGPKRTSRACSRASRCRSTPPRATGQGPIALAMAVSAPAPTRRSRPTRRPAPRRLRHPRRAWS